MQASVVVPTRDRPRPLARCLAALAAQSASELEIVIVDDGSHDRSALAAAIDSAAPSPRLLRTTGIGPAAARNLGARSSEAEVICFVDDDCEPVPGWAAALVAAALESGTAAGRTVVPAGSNAAVRASQAIVEHLTLSSLDHHTGRLGFAPTCNLAIARPELATLGFDESFPLAAGEDREWSARASAAGLGPAYTPEAVVVHRPQLGLSGFARQQFRYGRGAARYRARSGERPAPADFYAALVRRGFEEGAGAGALVIGAQGLTAAGVAAERLRRSAGEARPAGRRDPRP